MNKPSQILVFDRTLIRHRRNKAAAGFSAHSVLYDESGACLSERLQDVKRDFASILELGARRKGGIGYLEERKGSFIVAADISEKSLQPMPMPAVAADEELLPFASGSFDLVVSNLILHWANDLPGALAQIKNILRPEGLFMAALFGGQTLHELRACLLEAELSITGGVSPRLSPGIELQAASSLLQRIGFSLPVADREVFTLTYSDMNALMRDLRGMGETNAHLHRLRHPTRKAVFAEAMRLYQSRFADPTGRLFATFEVFFLHGWNS